MNNDYMRGSRDFSHLFYSRSSLVCNAIKSTDKTTYKSVTFFSRVLPPRASVYKILPKVHKYVGCQKKGI
jgi:hypothetical protein